MSVVPRVVTRNWRLKLAATGLAVFLWAVVRTAPDGTTATLPARVDVDMGGNPGWTTGPPEPPVVDMYVRGSFADIQRVRGAGTAIRVPLGEVAGGDTVVTLRRDWAEVEAGLSVERIEPAQVRLTFERGDSAAKPITLRPVGELPEGVALAQPLQLTPVVARVRGPSSRVQAVDSIPTLGPDLSEIEGIDDSGLREVPLDTAGFPGLTFSPSIVSVGVRLEEAVERELQAVPVVIAGLPEEVPLSELSAEPPLVEVRLRGGRNRVSQAQVPDLIAEVDAIFVQTMEPGEVRVVPLRLQGVPALVEATANPDSVRVRRRAAGEGGGIIERDGGRRDDTGGGAGVPGGSP